MSTDNMNTLVAGSSPSAHHHEPSFRDQSSRSAYRPSVIEDEWFQRPAKGRICELNHRQREYAVPWLNFADAARQRTMPPAPSAAALQVLSYFTRGTGLGARAAWQEYIEPLTGYARHPLSPVKKCLAPARSLYGGLNATTQREIARARPRDVMNTSYLILANQCDDGGEVPRKRVGPSRNERNFLFDLGCSIPSSNWETVVTPGWTEAKLAAGGHVEDGKFHHDDKLKKMAKYTEAQLRKYATVPDGIALPSLNLLTILYGQSCVEFDRIWAWEAASYPYATRHRTRFHDPTRTLHHWFTAACSCVATAGLKSGGRTCRRRYELRCTSTTSLPSSQRHRTLSQRCGRWRARLISWPSR